MDFPRLGPVEQVDTIGTGNIVYLDTPDLSDNLFNGCVLEELLDVPTNDVDRDVDRLGLPFC